METVEEGLNLPTIAPNRIESLEFVEEDAEDRISALPDGLIHEILSCLPSTKCAIKTGTLSKRWNHLWNLVPTLIFEDADDNHDFISFVDKALTQCRQSKLKKFVLYTAYDIRFESQFSNWIGYAMNCNVEELNLTLWNTDLKAEFLLDHSFFDRSSFTDLTLEGCIFDPIGAISWKNLRTLCITFGKLDEDLIKNILHGSPQLETFELNYCYGYRRLDIASKSVKKLVLSGYMVPYDKFEADIIELNAPNISSLTIQDELLLLKLLLLNVSSLVEANIDYRNSETTPEEAKEEMLKGFILNLRHVKELKIGGFCSEVVSRLEAKGFIFPSNVKFASS
ncbi:F-box/LRR-repeat protein 25 isoform X1 [Lactuca sativa]|uniref:At1g61320/AtMIF1 LRR domain-containing protein n=1 Tax=Lactuca sativa TaxID=4236 RepID=A0A9R1V0T1_LACSA|nr:F-box/LRR-repeat protein 25 isoform X1 [Lactuca sativa]KAJ0196527.1 hypothetical protein LSAT_V11C700352590 [Lactuca sativa]